MIQILIQKIKSLYYYMELLKSNFLMGGFVVGIFFSYVLFNTPSCINKQITSNIQKKEVSC